jgi:putative Holliday junction resolvase
MRLLALDVGDRRIGVAVSDPTGLIATPLAVVHRASKAEDFRRIAQLVREQEAAGLVVGCPLDAEGGMGPQARRIERYARALAEALRADGLDLPMVFWDESLSTRRAQEAMIGAGRKARHRRARIDAAAAAVILEDYLRARKASAPGALDGERQAGILPEPALEEDR